MQRWLAIPILFLLFTVSCLPAPPYTERNFTIAPGEVYTVAVALKEGNSLEGDFATSGQQNYIDFYIKDPAGGLAYGVVRAQGSQGFTLEATRSGSHTLYFDNSFSFGVSRHIALRYRAR